MSLLLIQRGTTIPRFMLKTIANVYEEWVKENGKSIILKSDI